MSLQFLDRNDLLVKLSRMVFEDFHNNIFALNADAQDETFLDVMQRFLEICEAGVKGIEQICADAQIDPNSKAMMSQLSLERSAYALILKIAHSNKLLNDNQNSTLLLWSEENALFSASEFSKIVPEDAEELSLLDNIYACTKMRGSVHIDSRFVDRIAAEDEEAVQTLNRMLFALLRAGRLDDAKTLLNDLKLPALSTFIFVREFLTNTSRSPLERFDEMFDFARSRLFFKQTARELIPADDVRVQHTDQCIWATLGCNLATLLSHAQSTEDRLWSYLSCAAEALLDDALLKVHAKGDDELNLLAMDIQRQEGTDLPKDVHSIFAELRNDDVRVQHTDQCIWATLGCNLATLLSHAQSTEDRLWSYLSCAAEALLDDALLKVHAKGDDELNLLAMDIQRQEGTDLPKDVHSIFAELRNSECRSYYVLFEHLALEQWDNVAESIGEYITNSKNVHHQLTAHELRFFVHLVILLKLSDKSCANWSISDQLIEHYCAMLVQMRLIAIVPFYLYHLSPEKSTGKMLDFLMGP
uniref:Nuclear pore complex protein n=1 Tax=Globodera pallida TaxID=36090 RepID=A0A183CCY4_GLOPA